MISPQTAPIAPPVHMIPAQIAPPHLAPTTARLRDIIALTQILWTYTRIDVALTGTPVRSRAMDLWLMAKIIRRGWVRMIRNAPIPHGFLARDGAYIHALYTHPAAQRTGIASALLQEAKNDVPRLELWTQQANTRARNFYASHGFVEGKFTDGGGNDEQTPDVFLTWTRTDQA